MGVMRSAYNILIGKHEGKRLLGRPWSRWGGEYWSVKNVKGKVVLVL
jgi:hypothetical protein